MFPDTVNRGKETLGKRKMAWVSMWVTGSIVGKGPQSPEYCVLLSNSIDEDDDLAFTFTFLLEFGIVWIFLSCLSNKYCYIREIVGAIATSTFEKDPPLANLAARAKQDTLVDLL